jgi:hypothetical protein
VKVIKEPENNFPITVQPITEEEDLWVNGAEVYYDFDLKEDLVFNKAREIVNRG